MCMCQRVFVWLYHLGRAEPDILPLGIFYMQILGKDVTREVSFLCLKSCVCLRFGMPRTASHCRNSALLNSCTAIPQLTAFASVGRGEVALPLHCLFLLY